MVTAIRTKPAPKLTTAPLSIDDGRAPAGPLRPPEFFRLPKKGPDPHYGLTRPTYYQLEKEGKLTLVRLRQEGRVRGITLVPYNAVGELLERAADDARKEAAARRSLATVQD